MYDVETPPEVPRVDEEDDDDDDSDYLSSSEQSVATGRQVVMLSGEIQLNADLYIIGL